MIRHGAASLRADVCVQTMRKSGKVPPPRTDWVAGRRLENHHQGTEDTKGRQGSVLRAQGSGSDWVADLMNITTEGTNQRGMRNAECGFVIHRWPQMATDVRGSERPGSPHRVQLLDLFDQPGQIRTHEAAARCRNPVVLHIWRNMLVVWVRRRKRRVLRVREIVIPEKPLVHAIDLI